jgi:tryptophan synthase alpha chain
MNRVDACFGRLREQQRCGLFPFVTCGDPLPTVAGTVALLHSLVRHGADLIELGMPFSDPVADGPVIEKASERAIAGGVDLRFVLACVRAFRMQDAQTPLLLMGYINPLEQYGSSAFVADAAAAGADALLLVDCPPEESGPLKPAFDAAGLHQIMLVAPTTSAARRARLLPTARGFVYYVSFKGITGAARLDARGAAEELKSLRTQTRVPLAVGFGIRDADSAAALAGSADAVVIGSALVERLAGATDNEQIEARVHGFMAPIRRKLDGLKHAA